MAKSVHRQRSRETRVFIPSKVSDNRYLGEDYVASLFQVGSPELVRAWLEGDWSVTEAGFFNDVWSTRNIIFPFQVSSEWLRFRSLDWGSRAPFSVGWWAVVGDDYQISDGRILPRARLSVTASCMVRPRRVSV